MATKIYEFTQRQNSAAFRLSANGGKMEVNYEFKDGNVLMNRRATCVLSNKFYQDLLEGCQLFKTGIIRLKRVIEEEAAEKKQTIEKKQIQEKVVNTAGEAIDWIANTFGVTVKTAKQAKDCAEKNGYMLTIKQ